MSRLPLVSVENSSEQSRLVFEQVRKAMGKLPNAYALIGGYSPDALSLLLSGDAALGKGQLSRQEIEAVRLAISTQNGCDYCVAAHSAVGKMVGLPAAELTQLRAGQPTGHNKRDALVGFARQVAGSRGEVDASVVQAVLAAGYTPGQVIEVLLVVALISFTNLVNRVNDTPIDFPKPE